MNDTWYLRVYSSTMRIVLIEDSETLARYTVQALEEAGYAVDWKHTGEAGEQSVVVSPPDLVILDRMLPGKHGIEVCRDLRSAGVHTPILMLTALDGIDERVEGLDSGADDYLIKPFELSELLARIRALLRRPENRMNETLVAGDLTLTPATRTITVRGTTINTTQKEFAILEYFMRNPGRVLTRAQILEHCWEFDYNPFSNIVDVYVRQLRTKIHDTQGTHIETVRGAGYRFRES